MKRIVCLLIAALSVSLLLCGCGQNSDPLAIREFIICDSIGTVEQRGSGKDAEYVICITLPIETGGRRVRQRGEPLPEGGCRRPHGAGSDAGAAGSDHREWVKQPFLRL